MPEWSQEDSKTLELFLSSDTGKKAFLGITQLTLSRIEHCIDSGSHNPGYSLGYAAGFRDGAGALQTMFGATPQTEENEQDEWQTLLEPLTRNERR